MAVELHDVIRAASQRLSQRTGWQRHVPWFLGAVGKAMDLSRTYLYKNYPNKAEELTAVRVGGWTNALHGTLGRVTDPRVTDYDTPFYRFARSVMSEGEGVSWSSSEQSPQLPAIADAGLQLLVLVPIHAGDQWWGFLGAERGSGGTGDSGTHSRRLLENVLWTSAAILGNAVHSNSTQQALRWSERLQRIQRDIALTASGESDQTDALSDLLGLICELGEFQSGVVELYESESLRPVSCYGDPPVTSLTQWCASCRPSIARERAGLLPLYGDSEDIKKCSATCGLKLHGIHSYAVVPIVHEGAVAGLLELFSDRRAVVPAAVRRSIEAVASEAAMVIARVHADQRRQRSDQRASELAERLQVAVEAGKVGVFEIDLDRNKVSLDPPLPSMLRLPSTVREVGLDQALSIFSAAGASEIRQLLSASYLEGSDSSSREFRVSPRGSPPVWLSVTARLVGSGNRRRVIGTVVDITRLKRIQEELSRAEREASDSSKAKGDFVARMSHEFRTPLNAILGSVQLLLDRVAEEHRDAMEVIRHSAGGLLAMVEDILDQGQLEAGRLQLRLAPVGIRKLLNAVEAEARELLRHGNVRLAMEVQGWLPETVSIDAMRLTQVLRNLVTNAVKFTESGRITLRFRWKDHRLRCAVSDTGTGIAAGERARVFLPFRRSSDESGQGSGLGLAISQELAQLMGSRIRLATRLGVGSVFWFTIPAPALDDTGVPTEAIDASSTLGGAEPDTTTDASPFTGPLPPREIIDQLDSAARIGDVAALQQVTEQIRLLGPRHQGFCRVVDELVSGLRIRMLRELAASARARGGADG